MILNLKLIKKIFVVTTMLLVASFTVPTQITAIDSCSAVSGCPTGDGAVGAGFTGLQPDDLNAGSFTVTLTGTSDISYSCSFGSGTAGRTGSCTAAYDGNDINCLVEHLDCRNKPFNVSVRVPTGYKCTPSVSQINPNNCSDNTPITVSCATVCVPDGSCNAPTPACGQTTNGTDNCGACSKTGPACPQTFTIGGQVTKSTGGGLAGVEVNKGVTNPPSCNIGTATTDASGNYSFTNVTKDLSFCLRPPSVTGYTGPDPASFENQTATANKTDYTFSYTAQTATPLTVTCSVDKTTANVNESVTWTATPTGGTGPYTYSWTGSTDALNTITANPATLSYLTTGTKSGKVTVTDSKGVKSDPTDCTNSVTITPFNFTVSNPEDAKLVKGSTDPGRTTTVTTTGGTPESVTLSLVGAIGGATATFNPASCTPTNTSCNSTLTFNTTSATAGTYTGLKVRGTTAGNTVKDSSTFTLTITQPNLTVDPLTSISVQVNTGVSPSATVRNNGTASTGVSSTTRLKIDTNKDGTFDSLADGDKTTGILAANGTASHTWSSVWTPDAAGTYPYQVCSDAGNVIGESAENDNCQTSSIAVSSSGIPPAPTIKVVTTNGCIDPGYTGGGVNISWNDAQDWADIDTDSSFAEPYYHKCVNTSCGAASTTTSTTAPNGFNAFPSGGSLSLNPDTPYYVRLFNSTTQVHSATATFSIPACLSAFNYSLTNSGNITVAQGQTGSNLIMAGLLSGLTQSVAFSPLGLPPGITYQFSPDSSCSPNCTRGLSIQTLLSTPTGTHPLTVTGASSGLTDKFTGFNLIVSQPDSGSPPTVDLKANSSNGPVTITHNSAANLSWTTSQNPLTCTASGAWFGSKSPTGGTELTGTLSGPASYIYNLSCQNPAGSNADSVTVNVTGPGGGDGGPACGDLICTLPETVATCPTDCGPPPCGDGICSASKGETTSSCPQDCQSCNNNNQCDAGETAATCPLECPGGGSNSPWIKTTGGDVHSNTGINTP